MNIAWFSPLAPARSEIASFSARLEPALRRCFDGVRLLAEDQQGFREPATGMHYSCPLGGEMYTLLPALGDVDVPIYHIGNNPDFHARTWFLSQRKPGVVVLHDLKLHHFFEGIYRARLYDRAQYVAIMRRYYGELGGEVGEAWWRQEVSINYLAEHFPMTGWALQNALAVVVHTEHARPQAQRATDAPVWLLPLAHETRVAEAALAARAAAGESGPFPSGQRVRLVIFGFLNVNRRIVEFLRALAAMPERRRFDVHLYGTIFIREAVEAAIASLGLGEQVTIHGFVAEEELEAGLAGSDLAINLRFPTMGEASASQLRIWDHALPSLVTRVDGYASLPADSVAFVRPEAEHEDIQRQLRRFLLQPGVFRQQGLRGRKCLVEAHSPIGYAAALRAHAELEIDALRARHTRRGLAARVGQRFPVCDNPVLAAARERAYAERILELC